ncbi:GPI-inositol-deacylase [Auriscalpium vulgare]|uniref:GPI-inositol-deacylase n=1 Tax=Auriscalpium vulgare TaxID=40419 RepID=A0ACB8RNZ1_9AGAM|nr:GPI-inositol-deacylase [Auriscalpium vulgare]
MTRISYALSIVSIVSLFVVYKAASNSSESLSPQGCRMSYMSPSYLLQPDFNSSWTHLANRYSLWLYREVGWEHNELRGVPVLFIPGNAGSSRQIRSIASSAARQYYPSPYTASPEFSSRALKPLDFYAVEYNEDLSAFHGPTLEAETAYASRAITHILSLYPANTSIIVMGHSMGGIVATALLPSPNISAVITMSTPHTLPPARFDRRIAVLYERSRAALLRANTPILSLCGGATDMMVPSEACILPPSEEGVYRRTVFSSALEGCWTGVGHQVMVWCHQVRWRVARAALELGAASSEPQRGNILDRWVRDDRALPYVPSASELLDLSDETLPAQQTLSLQKPLGERIYRLPAPTTAAKFVLFVSGGTIPPASPQNSLPLSASVYACRDAQHCTAFETGSLQLIPDTSTEKPFPAPHEGVDESEGVVRFEGVLPSIQGQDGSLWVAVDLSGGDGRGWVLGGFVDAEPVVREFTVHDILYREAAISVDPKALQTDVRLPHLLSNSLLVYRVTPEYSPSDTCSRAILPPLLQHASPSETLYHPLTEGRPIHLHSHTAAPFVPHDAGVERGINLTLYTSGECNVQALRIGIDWWGTLGRMGARYWAAVPGWAVGVVIWTTFIAWGIQESGAPMPTVSESLSIFTRKTLPWLVAASFAVSFLPLPVDHLLGNSGEAFFSPVAPFLMLVVAGLVQVSWWLLCALMWPVRLLGRITGSRRKDDTGIRKNTLFSMFLIFVLVFVVIPWQVAFLGCWIIHFFTCATHTPPPPTVFSATTPPASFSPNNTGYPPRSRSPPPVPPAQALADGQRHSAHLLLLMTWLLPLAAPVLAVWVRTLATAGLTTPFDGDHSFWTVAPYLVLVDFASWTRGPLLPRESVELVSIRWFWMPPAWVAFFWGAARTYEVFDWVWVVACLMVVIRVGPRYWGDASWSSASVRSR